ncbi:MAG: 3-phosphoshikimate 1-carboxyvinyltransferase [Prevotellaceae bacterium]|nr:3-phosphoshikimate 1-carboxyvinyltransferase [Prevotellaceae bacterium]
MSFVESIRVTAPLRLSSAVCLPASKSLSNRALILSALSGGVPQPLNLSDCDDTRVMLRALRMGDGLVDIGAAGTAMRFLTAYFSQAEGSHTITGTERMLRRPVRVLVDALRQLGASVSYTGAVGFPPLRIEGRRLRGGTLSLRGDVSSQYISALLMIAPKLSGGLRLCLTGGTVSRPYIDMTLRMMCEFGAEARWEGADVICVSEKPYEAVEYSVESDWSAAGYWYEAVALSRDADAEVTLKGLREGSLQGDSRVRDFFLPLGVRTTFAGEGVRLSKCPLAASHLELDLREQPDLAQTLVATCCCLGVTFRLTGLHNLRIKETDRITALQKELGKLGFVLRATDDGEISWTGERTQPMAFPSIDTYDDHRMAMSLAPCCLQCGALRVNNPQVVSKSYPRFWDDLSQAGFNITKADER